MRSVRRVHVSLSLIRSSAWARREKECTAATVLLAPSARARYQSSPTQTPAPSLYHRHVESSPRFKSQINEISVFLLFPIVVLLSVPVRGFLLVSRSPIFTVLTLFFKNFATSFLGFFSVPLPTVSPSTTVYTYTYTRTSTRIHTHAHTRAHTYTQRQNPHTHGHTHAHTLKPSDNPIWFLVERVHAYTASRAAQPAALGCGACPPMRSRNENL